MATGLDDLKSPVFWRGSFAEMIGTMFLVFIGCGSCINWKMQDGEPSVLQISLCFGLAVGTMVWCICHLSGGHINPAVTVGLLITRKISLIKAIFFIIAQCTGAVIGAGALKGLTPPAVQGALGSTSVNGSLSQAQGFGIEFMITFVLVFTVFASCDGKRTDLNGSAPLTIGLSVTLCHLFAIRFTGSSMNPARSFGPAVITGLWHEHWVYWCGPIMGGIVAALIYDNLIASNASLSKAKGYLLTSTYDPERFEAEKERKIKVEDDDSELKEELNV